MYMKKIAALDCGDTWTGTAISDLMGIVARPYETIASQQLVPFIEQLITKERVGTIVIGYPQTMRGTESIQTKKIVTLFQELKQQFSSITWVLWDERLTSKKASTISSAKTPQEKQRSHSIAAALILTAYLDHLHFEKNSCEISE